MEFVPSKNFCSLHPSLHGINLGIKAIICYDNCILEEAARTMPVYPTFIGYTQSVTGVQELQSISISGVHMPCSTDWSG